MIHPYRRIAATAGAVLPPVPRAPLKNPTGVNANKCISYQTIGKTRKRSLPILCRTCGTTSLVATSVRRCVPGTAELCQYHTGVYALDAFLSLGPGSMSAMDEDEFRMIFRHSAVKRAKFAGLKRNVAAISKTRRK